MNITSKWNTNVYYISNEYNRNAGLTVEEKKKDMYITIPLLDAVLRLKSIMKNGQMREFSRESIK